MYSEFNGILLHHQILKHMKKLILIVGLIASCINEAYSQTNIYYSAHLASTVTDQSDLTIQKRNFNFEPRNLANRANSELVFASNSKQTHAGNFSVENLHLNSDIYFATNSKRAAGIFLVVSGVLGTVGTAGYWYGSWYYCWYDPYQPYYITSGFTVSIASIVVGSILISESNGNSGRGRDGVHDYDHRRPGTKYWKRSWKEW